MQKPKPKPQPPPDPNQAAKKMIDLIVEATEESTQADTASGACEGEEDPKAKGANSG